MFPARWQPAPMLAQDMAGARDHPAMKRLGGNSMACELRNFDSVDFQISTCKTWDGQAKCAPAGRLLICSSACRARAPW